MNTWKILLPTMAALLFAGQAAAQTDESAEQRHAVEVREVEVRRIREREEEVERRMYDAERRMAEAARQIAVLTAERLPQLEGYLQRFEFRNDGRPRLGVTIGGDEDGPVEGAAILGVTFGWYLAIAAKSGWISVTLPPLRSC